MAESVVGFLLEKLVLVVDQEVELLKGVRNEINQMKDEFQSIKALLRDADAKVAIDQGVKEWVEQVRDVAYEIEDVLDEFILSHHQTGGRQTDSHDVQGNFVRSIASVFHSVIHLFTCLKVEHEIGTHIKHIRIRIQEISNRRQRYNLSSTSCIVKLNNINTNLKRDPREDALFLEEFQLVGIDGPREEITGYLLKTDDATTLGVVAIFGEGGLGKTTLVKKVYDSSKVEGHFPHRAWITVSQTFDAKNLFKSLVKQLFPELEGAERETMELIELKQMLNANLRGKRYVVVLDDIWNLDAWREFKNAFAIDNKSGSKIMVTTRFKSVADICIQDYGNIYSLQRLNFEDSFKLFSKKAFKSSIENASSCPELVLKNRSVKFLKKCDGLPLAIVAISGLLSTKQPSEWDQIYQNIGSLMDTSIGSQSQLEDLHLVISLSYNDLPYPLKSCFLYMCIFPEDYSIKCPSLLHLWVAEGFIERRRHMDMTMEELASLYLDELIQRSLVQIDSMDTRRRVRSCRIHDLVREFIIVKARDQNLATIITIGGDHGESPLLSGIDYSTGQKPQRQLSITCSGRQDTWTKVLTENSRSLSHLRSLFLFMPYTGTYLVHSSSTAFLSNFKLLRVLNLQDAGLEEFPNPIVNLFYLRYLSLRRNTGISHVPSLVGKLIHLETLDLKITRVYQLPVEILNLRHLRNLFIEHFFTLYQGVKLPVGIHNLATLEKLVGVDADDKESGVLVKELGMLTQLRKLGICNLRDEDGVQLFASVQKMKYLHSFRVSSKSKKFLHSNSLSSPPVSLKYLHMAGSLDELPSWILSLQNLEELHLSYSGLKYDPIEVLQVLPNLMVLGLHYGSFEGEELSFAKGGFPRLKKLLLWRLGNLNKVKVEEGAMPVVQCIKFSKCYRLEEMPLGLEHLTTLNEIEHQLMPQSFIDRLNEHCWKTGHLPRIVRY
ncbi:Disease resistance protein [Thalictrum thalictroides]|uniref:Disease resistance protein n=1 Tax=Thalictrum thalictroides TaxID=46969 RepID=A0A7J6X1N6_THATH|nr:Disease resistance protein [Thalictrum thalictroides]